MTKAVVFDVDDTLYNQIEPFERAIQTSFPDIAASQSINGLFTQFRIHSDEVFEAFSAGKLSLIDMRRYRLLETMKDIGLSSVSEINADVFQSMYTKELEQIVLQHDMHVLLDTLRNQGISIGVITNGPTSHQQKKITQLNLNQWVDSSNMLISESFGREKPYPDIFEEMEKRMGIDANNMLYVGDSFENDVVGASSRGWNVVWLNHRKRKTPFKEEKFAPIEVSSFEEGAQAVLDFIQK